MLSQRVALLKQNGSSEFEKNLKLFQSSQDYLTKNSTDEALEYYTSTLNPIVDEYIEFIIQDQTDKDKLLAIAKSTLSSLNRALVYLKRKVIKMNSLSLKQVFS